MNDSILRGFCQCGRAMLYELDRRKWFHQYGPDKIQIESERPHDAEGFGFLSPKQMKIIRYRIQKEWKQGQGAYDSYVEQESGIFLNVDFPLILESNPFLVASILSTSHSKEEGVKE